MAALRSASSSSSSVFFVERDVPFVVADLVFARAACGTYPDPECPFESSKLISNALLKSASKPSSGPTRASRGCIEPEYKVRGLFGGMLGDMLDIDLSISFA